MLETDGWSGRETLLVFEMWELQLTPHLSTYVPDTADLGHLLTTDKPSQWEIEIWIVFFISSACGETVGGCGDVAEIN